MEKPQTGHGDWSIGSLNGSKLSDDLLQEIISRLPAKSLFRFKSVSKAWCGLISADAFQRKLILSLSGLFYGISGNDGRLGLPGVNEWGYAYLSGGGKPGDGDFPDMSLRFLPGYPNISVLDSRNGLVLCLFASIDQTPLYYVCNPLTKRWISVSLPDGCSSSDVLDSASLAFDPSESIYFRIIQMPRPYDNPPGFVLLEIYSSDSGNWNSSCVECNDFTFQYTMRDAVFLNGHIYLPSRPCYLMRIDLLEMSSQTIELRKKQLPRGALGVYDGRLYYTNSDSFQLMVWMLEDCQMSRWSLKHFTPNKALARETSKGFCSRSLMFMDDLDGLAFHPDNSMIFLVIHCKIFAYNFSSTRLEEICSLTCNGNNSYLKFVFPFTPCLHSFLDA